MFARSGFNPYVASDFATANAGLIRALRRVPPGMVRAGVFSVAFFETWLRWPLATLHIGDRIDADLEAADPGGVRLGLTDAQRTAIKQNILYGQVADLYALMNAIDTPRLRTRALEVRGQEVIDRQRERGPGAIVVGFRTVTHPAFPWALASAAGEVSFIVGSRHLAALGERLGSTFIRRTSERVHFLDAQDTGVLARSLSALKAGGTVATLLELSPLPFQRTTPVEFLGMTIDVPYGVSYLSAMTGRPVIPAWLARRRGTLFRLSFGEPVPAPARNPAAIKAQTQQLYSELERRVRRTPEQWIGWTLLQPNAAPELDTLKTSPAPALS
jgi:lauroyl/myristoyl acyltransferase